MIGFWIVYEDKMVAIDDVDKKKYSAFSAATTVSDAKAKSFCKIR